jgi:threonine dehydratase
MILLSKIIEARKRLNGVIDKTPFAYAPLLSEQINTKVYLKKENLQITGAYKIRGAYNKIASLSEKERKKGVIAASAGNHAQGVAYSARSFDIPAIIVMPEATPLLKVTGTKALGADVILKGGNYDEAYAYAKEYAAQNDLVFIHPFNDDEVIAGQGTVALEMLEDVNDLDIVLVPIGGGGLISGVASVIKQLDPKIKVIGVTASGAPAMYKSYHAKKAIDTTSVRTIADGIAVRDTSEKNLNYILETVDDIIQVDDEEIANAILFLLEKQKLVVEGGGAVGVAALLHNKIKYSSKTKIGVIISGGNIDVGMLSVIIEKGLIKSHRKMKLLVTLIDKPGALRELTDILADANANIIQIDYDRTSTTLSYGDANVTLAIETKGKEHQDEIREKLKQNRYRFQEEF